MNKWLPWMPSEKWLSRLDYRVGAGWYKGWDDWLGVWWEWP